MTSRFQGLIFTLFLMMLFSLCGTSARLEADAYGANLLRPSSITRYPGTNPALSDIKAMLIAAGQKYQIPPHILFGIAYQESGWREYGDDGKTLVSGDGGIGIMQLTGATAAQFDVNRLASDIAYNIDSGASVLNGKWKITPIIGDNDRAKLENWYYAIWAYNGFVAGSSYPGTILSEIANCPNGQWTSVSITPPTSAQIASMGTIPNTPTPIHVDANFDGIIDSSGGGGGSAGMAVPQESQNDGRWKNDKLGPGPDTVGKLGCVVTDVAMVLEYYGTNTNPQELNNWLRGQTNPPGYDSQENLYWATAALHGNGVSYKGSYDWTNVPANLDIINSELDAGYPVIAHVSLWGSSHYVVITGRSGSSTYYVNDPWDGQKYTIPSSRYSASAQPSVAILGINMYHGQHGTADTTPPIVTITSGQTSGGTYNSPQRVTWHIDDGTGSGIDRWGQGWDQDPGANPYSTSDGYLDLPVGTHTLHVHVRDKAGNEKDWTFGPYIYIQPLQVGQGSDGHIDQRYVDCYNRVGPSIVGNVNSYVHVAAGSMGNGGAQDFVNGTSGQGVIMAKDGAAQAFNTRGNIWKTYSSLGYASSPLGFPTSDEQDGTPSPQGTAGRVSHFEAGVITSTPSGTYEVHGDIFVKYVGVGASGGPLGFPTGNTVVNPASLGRYGTTGNMQMFEGGCVFTSQSGTFEVHGTIWSNYALKILTGLFGFPTSDEQSATPSPQGTTGSVIHFEDGAVCDTAKYGVYGVSGTIFQKYATAAGSGGIYGFPTSEAYDWNGGIRQDFEGGYLTSGVTTHTHLLWKNSNGAAAIWSINLDGSFTSTPAYGPISGWNAHAIADGNDGKTRLLWTRSDGMNAVWTVNTADGTFTSTPGYGPIPGWNVASLAVGPDNLTRLQWKRDDGMSAVWTVAADGSFTSTPGFGPYGTWTASALAVGGDSLSRLLWGDGAGHFSFWTLDALNHISSTPSFGPIPGWSPSILASGPDANAHLMLNRSDGAMALWAVNGAGTLSSSPLYGPIPGWSAHGMAVGSDSLPRVLWSRSDGMSAVWTVAGDGSITSTPGYGPIPGWTATAVAAP